MTKENTEDNYSVFSFTFNQDIYIEESFIPPFSVSTFFADLGGSLGLWLGVGAVQLLTSGVTLFTWLTQKTRMFWEELKLNIPRGR